MFMVGEKGLLLHTLKMYAKDTLCRQTNNLAA